MTGKLIKHEWKTYSRAMIPILLFMAAITAAMWIANLFADEGSTRLAAFWFIMYSCTAIAVSVIAFLRPAVRFSKNLYGDEGYLVVDNINNPHHITVFDLSRQVKATYDAPQQISGYEYQIRSMHRTIEEGRLECPEMPHKETVHMMELMDAIRMQMGVRYPFE